MPIPDPNLMLTECDGTELVRVQRNGLWRWMRAGLFRRQRVEAYSAPAGKLVFGKPFASPPLMMASPVTVGGQLVVAIPSNVTSTGCDVAVMRSRGTLIASAAPFETVTGVAGSVVAIGL